MKLVQPEFPAPTRFVIRNDRNYYYTGHGETQWGQDIGPRFKSDEVLDAVKYGDVESVEQMVKNHKKWCIDAGREDLITVFDTCQIVPVSR